MMMRGLQVASLFVVYAGIGWIGDQAAGLLASEGRAEDRIVARVDVGVDPAVVVDVVVRASGACAFEVERRVEIALDGDLTIEAGAGSLRVEGRDDVSGVLAVGRACASSRELLEELVLSAGSSGGDVHLGAHYPDRRRWGGRGSEASIDLLVTMPVGTPVRIADSSGEIAVRGSGDLRVADSSGSIEVQGALGSVQIADGSGDVVVAGATGDVDISDGSGGIEVRAVGGSVSIRDGSGSIEIGQVGGDVRIVADGSGSIDVRQVAGDFTVQRDGSGGIAYADVAGRVRIPLRDRR
jgi:hypothetical protein